MRPVKTFLQVILFGAFLFGCSYSGKEKNAVYKVDAPSAIDGNDMTTTYAGNSDSESFSSTDANNSETKDLPSGYFSADDIISSSAAIENKKDTLRKFIRTADLKFRVKDVAKATYAIEDIAAKFNGFVTYTNLFSTITNQTTIPVSEDSSLETIYYVVQNNMTLRVPNVKLDSTLKAIAPVVDYLDHRIIQADDVRFQLLENRLKQERSAKYQERLSKAVDDKGKKLSETTNAEDKILSKDEEADKAFISNLKLADQISYSTIQLFIYQREVMKRELIGNDKNIEAYKPNFFIQIGDALKTGWRILEEIVLFLAKSWGVILIVVALIALVRFVFLRRRSNSGY